ncbi:MAG TPA: thiamine phosphate synthase [Deltaproteobacteria bacterium]|nr:thiamine phosphate synthase [Deltaproteobacteria bacterium]
MSATSRPILCLVTDRSLSRRPLEEVVSQAVASGVDWVQVREKDLAGKALFELSQRVARAARSGAAARGPASSVRVVVNRRTDVALALSPGTDIAPQDRIDGVHLGFDGVGAAEARHLLGPDAWIGVSCHAPEEALAAREADASYVHLAPIFSPISKRTGGPPLGPRALAAAARSGLPVLAQGGVDPENAGEAVSAGAAGVAVTGAILMAADPGEAAGALRRALDTAGRGR